MAAERIGASDPSRALRNFLAVVTDNGFKIEDGEFGPRLILQDVWSSRVRSYMSRYSIRELRLNYDPVKRVSVGSLDFLVEVPELEGMVVLDHTIEDLSPIDSLQRLRSLSLGRGTRRREHSVSLLALRRLESLYLSERIPNEDDVFGCSGLKKLALTKFPGKISSAPLSALASLRYLSLRASGLAELRGISSLQHLEELRLGLMQHLGSLRGVEGLRGLRTLRIQGAAHVGSLEAIRGLREVRCLWLGDCGALDSLEPVGGLVALEEIVLAGSTKISDGDLSVLKRLPRLKRAGIAHHAHYSMSKQEVAQFNASRWPMSG